jgi:hypothetical protein
MSTRDEQAVIFDDMKLGFALNSSNRSAPVDPDRQQLTRINTIKDHMLDKEEEDEQARTHAFLSKVNAHITSKYKIEQCIAMHSDFFNKQGKSIFLFLPRNTLFMFRIASLYS